MRIIKQVDIKSNTQKLIMIKSRRVRWAGHVARIGRSSIHIRYWWESQKERDH
jgi:hypothetical protein